MAFRVVMLVFLLLAQPLAAFELNCGMGMDMGTDMGNTSADSSEHCAGHTGDAGHHQQSQDDQPVGHAVGGGHCQSCTSGMTLLPDLALPDSILLPAATTVAAAIPAPQFQSGPLYRPPIRR